MNKRKAKQDLITNIANELFRFNFENKKWKVADEFTVDGKTYSMRGEIVSWLKRTGLSSFAKAMEMLDQPVKGKL